VKFTNVGLSLMAICGNERYCSEGSSSLDGFSSVDLVAPSSSGLGVESEFNAGATGALSTSGSDNVQGGHPRISPG